MAQPFVNQVTVCLFGFFSLLCSLVIMVTLPWSHFSHFPSATLCSVTHSTLSFFLCWLVIWTCCLYSVERFLWQLYIAVFCTRFISFFASNARMTSWWMVSIMYTSALLSCTLSCGTLAFHVWKQHVPLVLWNGHLKASLRCTGVCPMPDFHPVLLWIGSDCRVIVCYYSLSRGNMRLSAVFIDWSLCCWGHQASRLLHHLPPGTTLFFKVFLDNGVYC